MRYFKKTDACSELITQISDLACDITTLCGIRENEDSSEAVADTTQLLFAFEKELDEVADLLFSARMENDKLKEENQKLVVTKQIWMEAAMKMAKQETK